MKCYYEELGIARDASDSDIKTAYKKLALRWHPDKNPENSEEAKQRFLLIQQAYEVLSDPQERAFYDNHREQIIRGKSSNYEDNSLNVFEYFTVTCFKGFGDDAKGFYAVYREVFKQIAAEDAEFMDDEADLAEIPTFGKSDSSYEEVVGPFYAYWSSYCTKKSYTWLCPYDIQETKDRRIIRAIEKEMKKIVQKARKERNDEVRSLVAFVKKRDKRVQEYNRKLEERVAQNRQKQEQIRLEQMKKRQQELREMQKNTIKSAFDDAYEARLKELEQQYGNSSDEDEDDDEDDAAENDGCDLNTSNAEYIGEFEEEHPNDVDVEEQADNFDSLFCAACNKTYKTKRAYVTHESGKKHIENMEKLKKEDGIEEAEQKTEAAVEEPVSKGNRSAKKSKSKQSGMLESAENLTDLLSEAIKLSDEEKWDDKKSNKKKRNKKTAESNAGEPLPNSAPKPAVVEENEKEANAEIHACATCQKQFNSKNKLFTHLKSTNHSIYIPGKGRPALEVDIGSKKGKSKRK